MTDAFLGPYPLIIDGARLLDLDPIGGTIYGLADPREPGRIRYVGATKRAPIVRLVGHMEEAIAAVRSTPRDRRGAKDKWLSAMMAKGRAPLMVELEVVRYRVNLNRREAAWFTALRARGEADLNGSLPPTGKSCNRDGIVSDCQRIAQKTGDLCPV